MNHQKKKHVGLGIVSLVASTLSLQVDAAAPMIGRYWAFGPCSSAQAMDANRYESRGETHSHKHGLYDAETYRGEIASKITKLMSKSLNQDICISAVDKKIALQRNDWWFLLPKPRAIFDLKNQHIAFHLLKQISIVPHLDGTYCSSLVVKANSPIHHLADLKDKSIMVSSYHSMGTYLYPRYVLKDFFKANHIRIIPGKPHENNIQRIQEFFKSPQYDESALIVYKIDQHVNSNQYRTLMKFCGIPEYVLLSNDKYVSQAQRDKLMAELKNYHGKHITWVEPHIKRLNAFYKIIKSESHE